ncbi:hypothetical protein Q3G72_028038 [Acer saccharum]|nr:hypothetical protein Q3G72_028038 [Acer saccharum]
MVNVSFKFFAKVPDILKPPLSCTKTVRDSPKNQIKRSLEDGYEWRKYRQKDILEPKYPRSYYRCAYRRSKGCLGTKTVQRSNEDPTMFEETSLVSTFSKLRLMLLEAEKQTVTNLQFYFFHDTLSGKNPSAVRVAQASEMTDKSPSLFGMVMMVDNPLTETLDPKSKPVGCTQGLYGSATQAELGLIMVFKFGFT